MSREDGLTKQTLTAGNLKTLDRCGTGEPHKKKNTMNAPRHAQATGHDGWLVPGAPWGIPVLVGLLCSLVLVACGRGEPEVKPIAGPPKAGALYSWSDGEGGFRVAFVRLFSQRWTHRPTLAQAHAAIAPIPLAYSFATLAGMQLVHLEDSQATPEELELYQEWKRGKQDVF